MEGTHQTSRETYGTCHTGIEMLDALSAEQRHCHNLIASETHQKGFPKVGHFDTWLVDQEQMLVEKHHNILLYPTWSNPASDYLNTEEPFQTVPLHSKELDDAINNLNIPKEVQKKISNDQKFLCWVLKTKAPILPIHGREAYARFKQIMINHRGPPNDDVAMKRLEHVDAQKIFPTTPFYLQIHHFKWMKNQRFKDCINRMTAEQARLDILNLCLLSTNQDLPANIEHSRNQVTIQQSFPKLPPQVPVEGQEMIDSPPLVVGLAALDRASTFDMRPIKFRKRGEGSKDCQPRRPRTCKRCCRFLGEYAERCIG